MANSIYTVNKGINRSIEFRGLRAQYIGYLAVGLVALFLLFTALFLAGVSLLVCLLSVLCSGAALFAGVYRLNRTFGPHGLLKRMALRSLPRCVRVRSRRQFLQLIITRPPHDSAR